MKEGLWKYVRHPNYTAEQTIWVAFYFFGVSASGKWLNLTISGSLLLMLLFAGSTGFTESISSNKYLEYKTFKQEVPRFLPINFKLKSIFKKQV